MVGAWVVLKTKPRREPLAAQAVEARGVHTYLPRLPHRPPSGRANSAGPLFPGYVFARVCEGTDDILRARCAPGVSYVLPRVGAPARLEDGVINAIRTREHELKTGTAPTGFSSGDAVRVMSGPFRWVTGLFDRRLNAAGRVRILLQLVNGTLALQIQEADLAHEADARMLEAVRTR
jgi:transcriptional antiterminator RfaH